MPEPVTHINSHPLYSPEEKVDGQLTLIQGEEFFCIRNYDLMKPFLMSIVSSSDLWMYLSSSGGLTAGRENYNNALFPYETDDKVHEAAGKTGPKTLIAVKKENKRLLWEPFSKNYEGLYRVRRNLYKNTQGNKVIFEEINETLQLIFSYSWTGSDAMGWVRKASIRNLSGKTVDLEICDGLLNILPWGIERETQSMMSTLMDAYKVGEYLPKENMALFYLASVPVDRAEPSEALRTNTVWSHGLKPKGVFLSSEQMDNFRKGKAVAYENKVFGQKTAFLLHAEITLEATIEKSWFILGDVAKDHAALLSLKNIISRQSNMVSLIDSSLKESTKELTNLVALADGIQNTGDPFNDRRHFANVLFNIMRGGVFEQEYSINVEDFLDHLLESNKRVYEKHKSVFSEEKETIPLQDLLRLAGSCQDEDLFRLSLEYLPLSFSRRHGDPSRPWNFFDIRVKKTDGSPSLNYQGNWRDIFQNWEALAFSFPAFLPGMISRFLNASTADGYNPYRITRQGFDWEVPEPDNPWAGIGYWGDHQVIYLLKLLELQEKFYPGQIWEKFSGKHFVYARVPYRIKSYKEILKDPQDTIEFDSKLHDVLMKKSREAGADGKLMLQDGELTLKATFKEKILVMLLTKLSNFVPEAGIWLNTQRPEWNDANNALVGFGTSMVTLYHLRRFVKYLTDITKQHPEEHFLLAEEVFDFKQQINDCLNRHSQLLDKGFSDEARKEITDQLGLAGEKYREKAYKGFSGKGKTFEKDELLDFYKLILEYLDQSISVNRRKDGLYHSYNLLEFGSKTLKVNYLYLMLEGQTAILNSGLLSPADTLKLLQNLFASNLWRKDQQSFMLYPFRELPGFQEKNNIPPELVKNSRLLNELLSRGNTRIIKQDEEGNYHFNADLKNARLLEETLHQLSPDAAAGELGAEVKQVLEIYEKVFNHRSFTGRSGSFYKYEGLGSIYWHMVSKLLLALGENLMEFARDETKREHISPLKEYYYRIREGIGAHKKPQDYGAFPTDPYSHTPSMMGAQQPGMTGQVKEDILSRFNELGIVVENGQIIISPDLLQENDFTRNKDLEFSFCSTRFIFKKGKEKGITIHYKQKEDKSLNIPSLLIPPDLSAEIFNRTGQIREILVYL